MLQESGPAWMQGCQSQVRLMRCCCARSARPKPSKLAVSCSGPLRAEAPKLHLQSWRSRLMALTVDVRKRTKVKSSLNLNSSYLNVLRAANNTRLLIARSNIAEASSGGSAGEQIRVLQRRELAIAGGSVVRGTGRATSHKVLVDACIPVKQTTFGT